MLGDETSGSGVDLRLAGNQPIRGLDKGHGLTLPAGKLSKKPLLQASCLPVGGNCTNSSSALIPPSCSPPIPPPVLTSELANIDM